MGRRLFMAMTTLICVIVLAAPVTASAEPTSIRWQTVEEFGREKVQKYAHLHRKWLKRAGRAVVGRQIVKFGMPKKGKGKRVATRKEWRRTMAVFDRWENPVIPAPSPSMQLTGSATSDAYVGGTGSYAIPLDIVMCESGGNYGAVNTSNSNRPAGAYQIITSTWLGYGGGQYASTADQASPAEQDAIAAKIWNGGVGRGQWAC